MSTTGKNSPVSYSTERATFNTSLIALTAFTALLLGGSLYYRYRNKKRDELATALLDKIRQVVQPGYQGIETNKALDVYYLQKLYRTIPGKYIIPRKSLANQRAEKIHKSWGWWGLGDDEMSIYGVFRSMADKVESSLMAKVYLDKYKVDLKDHLKAKLSKKELDTIYNIIQKLPDYRAV